MLCMGGGRGPGGKLASCRPCSWFCLSSWAELDTQDFRVPLPYPSLSFAWMEPEISKSLQFEP